MGHCQILEEVEKMINQVNETWGGIDILINNAGIIDDNLLIRMSFEAWDRVIATNLNGTFYCTKAVIRNMIKQRWGRIINIGSVVGIRGNIGQSNYSASKAGVLCMTKSLTNQVKDYKIRVNTISPGPIESPMTENWPSQRKIEFPKNIPLGRLGKPSSKN